MRTYYLDEEIVVTFSVQSGATDRFAQYMLSRIDADLLNGEGLFVGNVFIEKGKSSVEINVSNILRSIRENNSYLAEEKNETNVFPRWMSYYQVLLLLSETATPQTEMIQVFESWKHPSGRYDDEAPFQNYEISAATNVKTDFYQGDMVPRIPMLATSAFSFDFVFMPGYQSTGSATITGEGILKDFTEQELEANNSRQRGRMVVKSKILSDLFDGAYCETESYDITATLSDIITEDENTFVSWAALWGIDERDAMRMFAKQEFPYLLASAHTMSASAAAATQHSYEIKSDEMIAVTVISNNVHTEGGEAYLNITNGGVTKRYMNIDCCPARFYVKWQDRFGGTQVQPFNAKYRYGEGIEREFVTNYNRKKREIVWNVTPHWTVNSNWIKEEDVPLFESIYVSPYIVLYDTVLDKSYNVVLEDSEYEEKRYANEKKLISIQLELKHNKQQNILN